MGINRKTAKGKLSKRLAIRSNDDTRRSICSALQEELRTVQDLRDIVGTSLAKAPEGSLRAELARGRFPQYYLLSREERERYPRGRFLRKNEKDLVRALAQKEYDQKMSILLEKQEKALSRFLKEFPEQTWGDVFQHMSKAKRSYVEPYLLTDEEFLEAWEQKYGGQQNSFPISDGFITEGGELVRSKSEKMIADKLRYSGITYRYEAKLMFSDGEIVYPDFTILNMRTRRTYYLEHFGMMDNPEYCRRALLKIDRYESNKIYHGEQLLVTMECSSKGINMKQVNQMIDRYFR